MSPICVKTLEDAIANWREFVKLERPLFQDLPLETASAHKLGMMHKTFDLWMFANDTKTIFAHLYKPKEIDEAFEKIAGLYASAYGSSIATKGMKGSKASKALNVLKDGVKALLPSSELASKLLGQKQDPEFIAALQFHNNFSLLLHELFHFLECPDSEDDKKEIYKAIAAGIKKAIPGILESDLVIKTHNVENLIWDFCIDTSQYSFISSYNFSPSGAGKGSFAKTLAGVLQQAGYAIDGTVPEKFPEGVLPLFDAISCVHEQQLPRGLYALNRYTYSLLFCRETKTRQRLLDYFEKKIAAGGITSASDLVQKSLEALIKEVPAQMLSAKKIVPAKFHSQLAQLFSNRQSDAYDNAAVITTMTALLQDKTTRYDALKGYIQPLAHLIDTNQYEPRCGMGMAAGTGAADVLNALLEGMSPQQQAQFLQQLAQQGNAHGGKGGMGGGMGGGKGAGASGAGATKQALGMVAQDLYYKKHAPKMSLQAPGQSASIMNLGKIKQWVYDHSVRVPLADLHHHQRWIDYAMQHQIHNALLEVSTGLYVVNYYRLEETEQQAHTFSDNDVDVARNWVLINDSSGTMTMAGTNVGCGSRWDGLLHINYGLLKALYDASTMTRKNVDAWVVNFSDSTIVEGPIGIRELYETMGKGKENLLVPQSGGTDITIAQLSKIESQLHEGRTVWSFTTDGDIYNASAVQDKIEQLIAKKDHAVLFWEIFQKSNLGTELETLAKSHDNLRYQSITDLKQILAQSMDVLIRYR